MDDSSTDNGTVLKPSDWGMIWSEECQHFHLLVPEMSEDSEVPDEAILLTAVYIRIERDPEFRQEMIDWFKELKTD